MPEPDRSGITWRPRADRQSLLQRAELLARVRAYFARAKVLEVTPPVLGRRTVTAPNIHSIEATAALSAPNERLFLQTSPEYAMKRMLAAGVGPIYAITPAFRDGEVGRYHNPEFTLLEWYRPGFSLEELMQDVAALLAAVMTTTTPEHISYRQAFSTHAELDSVEADTTELAARCRREGADDTHGLSRDDMLDLLFSHCVQPHLGAGPVFVHGYPPTQAALARLSDEPEPVALRFELFVDGIELANGYEELLDPAEQRARFENDQAERARAGLAVHDVDEALLGALETGLPPCSGVALGVDRLLMVQAGHGDLRDTLAFPFAAL